jgi:DNA-binding transcriptional MerR regulator
MKRHNDSRFGTVKTLEKIGVSSERLRYWEKMGIVSPTYVKCGMRKFRRYSQEDIKRAVRIKELVDEEGYSLGGAMRKLDERDARLNR